MHKCLGCPAQTSNPKFCTAPCARLYHNHAQKGTQRIERHPCLKCGAPTLKKFCSRSCSVSYNNALSPKRTKVCNSEPAYCRYCGQGPLKRYGQLFCSSICGIQWRSQEKVRSWMTGEWDGSDKRGELSTSIRNWIFKVAGESCWECGWNKRHPTSGQVPLQVEHIDGNFRNNSPSNLKLLCGSCHSLTLTWGAYNKGKGREYRYANK